MKSIIRLTVLSLFILTVIFYSCKKEEVPTLTTSAISNITASTATCGGTITNENSGTVIARGVCWSTAITPNLTDSKTTDGAGAGTFTSNISGLTGATTYYVRAYATNKVGTGYGMAMSIITLGQAPTAATQSATNITATTATLDGSVNANYLSTEVSFEYGTTTNYGSTITSDQSPLIGNTIINISANLSGLTSGTTYHYRIKAINSLGTIYGDDSVFTTLIADIDGNVYTSVIIGTQVWFVENLKSTKYNDNTSIPLVTNITAWSALSTPAYCWQNNDAAANKATYGALYNWYAVDAASNNNKNICPTGWHVPSDSEWTTLENYLITNGYNFDGTTTGNKVAKALASETGWASSSVDGAIGNSDHSTYINKSGFKALSSGYRYDYGSFTDIGFYANWWSSTDNASDKALERALYFQWINVIRDSPYKRDGLSVRCLKD
jgi:uncharacterized protein (TIGR02145 family)